MWPALLAGKEGRRSEVFVRSEAKRDGMGWAGSADGNVEISRALNGRQRAKMLEGPGKGREEEQNAASPRPRNSSHLVSPGPGFRAVRNDDTSTFMKPSPFSMREIWMMGNLLPIITLWRREARRMLFATRNGAEVTTS